MSSSYSRPLGCWGIKGKSVSRNSKVGRSFDCQAKTKGWWQFWHLLIAGRGRTEVTSGLYFCQPAGKMSTHFLVKVARSTAWASCMLSGLCFSLETRGIQGFLISFSTVRTHVWLTSVVTDISINLFAYLHFEALTEKSHASSSFSSERPALL